MLNTTLKVGIVGVGRFGSRHLDKWMHMDGVRLVGFYDIDDDVVKRIESEAGIPCLPLMELIEQADIVDIVVPISSHYDVAKKALEGGKHVFVEKSFAEFPEQAEELTEISIKKGLQIGIGHIERYNPVLIKLKDMLVDPPSKLLTFRQGPFIPGNGVDVSIVKELMIHDIDLITHFIPFPIESIQASGKILHSNKIDRATAIINFANGSEAILFASRAEEYRRREVLCSDGKIDYKADLMNRALSSTANSEMLEFDGSDAMMDELSAYVDAIRHNRRYIVNAHIGCATMEIAQEIEDKILES